MKKIVFILSFFLVTRDFDRTCSKIVFWSFWVSSILIFKGHHSSTHSTEYRDLSLNTKSNMHCPFYCIMLVLYPDPQFPFQRSSFHETMQCVHFNKILKKKRGYYAIYVHDLVWWNLRCFLLLTEWDPERPGFYTSSSIASPTFLA